MQKEAVRQAMGFDDGATVSCSGEGTDGKAGDGQRAHPQAGRQVSLFNSL
jgi:hypothetical protein